MKPFRVAVAFDRASLQVLGQRYTVPSAGNIGSFTAATRLLILTAPMDAPATP